MQFDINENTLNSALQTFRLWEMRESEIRDPEANYRLLAVDVAKSLIHEKLRQLKTPQSPCLYCSNRFVGCRSICDDYKRYMEE